MTSGRGPHASGVSAPNSDQVFLHVPAGMTVIVEEGKDLRMADVIWVDGGARNPKVLTLLQVADEHRPHQLGQRLPGDPHRFKGLICTLPCYQMTCPVPESAISEVSSRLHRWWRDRRGHFPGCFRWRRQPAHAASQLMH